MRDPIVQGILLVGAIVAVALILIDLFTTGDRP